MFIYDIEIANPIPPSDGNLIKGLTYAKGWEHPATMGVACIGVYDYTRDTYRVFGEYELEDFQKLIDAHDVAIGFNNIKFDNGVLRACDIKIDDRRCYDILAEIYGALGSRQKGCKLDNVIQANFSDSGKNGDGALAPVLWQQGYHARVIDYCLNDVRLTKKLTDKILRSGYINNPIQPSQVLRLRRP